VELCLHFGPANDVTDYMQESGRAGREEENQCLAILLNYKQSTGGRNVTEEMKNYVRTKECRRTLLFSPFVDNPKPIKPMHKCCDNCASLCNCGDCPEIQLLKDLQAAFGTNSSDSSFSDSSSMTDEDACPSSDSSESSKSVKVLSDSE